MIFLISRPFVFAFKLLMMVLTSPYRLVRARRNRAMRKDIKVAAAAARERNP